MPSPYRHHGKVGWLTVVSPPQAAACKHELWSVTTTAPVRQAALPPAVQERRHRAEAVDMTNRRDEADVAPATLVDLARDKPV